MDDREEAGSLVDAAYRQIKKDILRLERKPGEQLKIEHLKKQYGFGMGPLREALQRLSADGLVRPQVQRGFVVAPLSLTEMRDLTMNRIFVEQHALGLSMKKGDDRWEAAVISAAYRLEKYDSLLPDGFDEIMETWEEANREFHDALVQACGSPWALRLRKILYERHERYRRASVGEKRHGRNLKDEHRAICEAVLKRDRAKAFALTAEHIEATQRGFDDWAKHENLPD